MKRGMVLATVVASLLVVSMAAAAMLHAPHDDWHGLDCRACHQYPLDGGSWTPGYPPANPTADDTLRNFICLRCHDGAADQPGEIAAPVKAMHSSLQFGNSPGWTTQCVDCHDPHFQAQLQYLAEDGLYLARGTITAVSVDRSDPAHPRSTVAYALSQPLDPDWQPASGADWAAKSGPERGLIFLLFNGNNSNIHTYEVLDGDSATVTVAGDLEAAAAGSPFGIIYGQLLRSQVRTPAGTHRTVRFFDPNGGFTDVVNQPPQGICQVCHTVTDNWRSDGTVSVVAADHYTGARCTLCHPAADGFAPQAPDHLAAGLVTFTPLCANCHQGAEPVADIHATDCAKCHTTPPALASAAERNYVSQIVAGDCATCHTAYFQGHTHHTLPGQNLLDSPECVTCHGAGDPLAVHNNDCWHCHDPATGARITGANGWGDATVNNGAGGSCTDCHGTYFDRHTYGDGHLRLALRAGDLSGSTSCNGCHGSDLDTSGLALDSWLEIRALHDTITNGDGPCATCHRADRLTNDPANPNETVADVIAQGRAGAAVGCLDCHPSRATGHGDHVEMGVITGYGSCNPCHDPDGVGTSSFYTESLHPGCTTCHQDPAAGDYSLQAGSSAAGHGRNDAGFGNPNTCATCHGTIAADWYNHDVDHQAKGFIALSTDCAACHAVTLSYPGFTDTSDDKKHDACSVCHNADGSLVDPAAAGNAQCTTCHGAYFDRHQAIDHSYRLALATSCSYCHGATAGTAAGVPTDPLDNRVHDGCTTCHASDGSLTGVAAGHGGATPSQPNTCTTCHGGFGTAVHTAVDHWAAVSLATDCSACHPNTAGRPNGMVVDPADNLIHDGCAQCHGTTGELVGSATGNTSPNSCHDCHGDFATKHATVDHSAAVGLSSECASCHDGTQGAATGMVVDPNDPQKHDDCAQCHGATGALVGLAAGNTAPNLCVDCHGQYFPNHSHDHTGQVRTDGVTSPPTAHCTGCHQAATPPFVLPGEVHGGAGCATCHDADGSLRPPAVTGGGGCADCHTTYFNGHSHQHGVTVRAGIDLSAGSPCTTCHGRFANTWFDILGLHRNACTTCHDASRQVSRSGDPQAPDATIQDVIHTYPDPVGCLDCHYDKSTPHMPDHTAGGYVTATPSCVVASCHDQPDQVNDTHKGQCAHCHASPDAGDYRLIWYAAGHRVPEDGPVNTCTTCHDYGPSFVIHHEAGMRAKRGDCHLCHTDPRPAAGVAAPNQLSCRECHMDYDLTTRTLTVMAIDVAEQGSPQATGTQEGNIRTPVPGHSFSGSFGVINNYGACLECHGATGRAGYETAPRMLPYHALRDVDTIGGVGGQAGGPETIPGEQFRTGFTGELYKTGVGNSRPTHYIGIDAYFGPGRGIFNIGFARHSLPMRWLQGSVFQRNLNRMWEPWSTPKTSEPYTFFQVAPQRGAETFFVPKFEEVNYGSAQGKDDVTFLEAPSWRDRVLTVRASSSSNGGATLHVIYGGIGYPMTHLGNGEYELVKDFSGYPEHAYNSQVIGPVWVVSDQGGNASYTAPGYTTPTADRVTVSAATWDGGRTGAELQVTAVNTLATAQLTVTYNAASYPMVQESPNHWTATISDPVFVPGLTVTSDAGADAYHPVTNLAGDQITVITAEWVQNNTGRELTVRATNTVAGAELWVTYNGVSYQMAEDAPNLYSRAIADVTYAATLDIESHAPGGGAVYDVPVRQLFQNEDHPHIVPGRRNSPYLDTLSCFTNYCHSGNTYDEHLTPGGIAFQVYQDRGTPFQCSQCHVDAPNDLTGVEPSIDSAIHTGAVEGNDVYCSDCHRYDPSRSEAKYHDPNYSIARQHHENAWEVKDGDCTLCHIDPRLDPYGTGQSLPRPKMLPCLKCHVDSDPSGGPAGTGQITIYKSRVGSQVDPYNGNVEWQWQFTGPPANTRPETQDGIVHQWNVKGGMIRNFGVCLFCHKMRPYHARPVTPPTDVDRDTVDPVNDPPHFAGPGRGTLGVFYAVHRKPFKYYQQSGQSANRNVHRDIRDHDATPMGGVTWWANVVYDPQDPNRYIPSDHTMGVPEYFTIPTFDPPTGNDTVTVTSARFSDQNLTLEVTATNTATDKGYLLYAVHHGRSLPMVQGPTGTWNVTFTDFSVAIGDNPGRVYVISVDPARDNELQAQAYKDISSQAAGDVITVTRAQWNGQAAQQLLVEASNTAQNAILTVHYGPNTYQMAETGQNSYRLEVTDDQYFSTITVTSDQSGETFANVTDVTPPSDTVTISRAEYNSANPGGELVVEAVNSLVGAELTAHYNGQAYPMTASGANSYTLTTASPAYAAQVTVTSSLGGSATGPVTDLSPADPDHPHIVPGIRNSPYLGILTCFKSGCHAGNTYDEHLTASGIAYQKFQQDGTPFDCRWCHQYTGGDGRPQPGTTFNDDPVINSAISTGVDGGQEVYCSDCHHPSAERLDIAGLAYSVAAKYAGSYRLADRHHATSHARAGDCVACHVDPRLDPYGTGQALPAPKQLPCRNCHADIDPTGGDFGTGQFTVYRRRSGGQVDPYNGNVDWQWQFTGPIANTDPVQQTGVAHQWNVDGGNIQNYGVCLFCHKMRPYHARPAVMPTDVDMTTLDPVNDPPHYAGPGRATLGVFYPFHRKPFQYYKNADQRQQGWQNVYKAIRDHDAQPRADITWWSNVVYDPQSDPTGMVPADHVMGVPEYFTIPTFDPPVGGDTVTITSARFSDNQLDLEVSATNTATGVILYVVHGGQRHAMTEGPANTWNVTISGYGQQIGDSAGRVYVISVDPNGNDVVLDQAVTDL